MASEDCQTLHSLCFLFVISHKASCTLRNHSASFKILRIFFWNSFFYVCCLCHLLINTWMLCYSTMQLNVMSPALQDHLYFDVSFDVTMLFLLLICYSLFGYFSSSLHSCLYFIHVTFFFPSIFQYIFFSLVFFSFNKYQRICKGKYMR